MRHISPGKAALAVGSVIGIWHLAWASLVGLGFAKPLLDLITKLHFVQPDYQLEPFALGTALLLVVVTFTIGALFGVLFALVWNWLAGPAEGQRKSAPAHAS